MNYKLVGAALLALAVVATGAAAAAPGNAPVDAPIDDRTAQAGNAAEAGGLGGAADTAASETADDRGPPVDLPSQVPDFVGEIHDLIRQHVEGSLQGVLGEHVSDATPDDDSKPADATPDNATAA